jgi:hypothetical protein
MWDVWHKQYAGGCTIATKRQIVWSLTRHSPGCSGWGRGLAEESVGREDVRSEVVALRDRLELVDGGEDRLRQLHG